MNEHDLEFCTARNGMACVLVIAIFVILAGLFASSQSIWVDESTQLLGLTLSPVDQVQWLAGWEDHDFGVPDDRMPPMSYWTGWTWALIFGLSENSMRWFGIACVAVGIPGLWLASRRIGNALGANIAILLFALSPNTIMAATEIRAYPLFLSLSCWSCYAFIGLVSTKEVLDLEGERRRRVWWSLALVAFTSLAAYTHFYGVLMAGTLWVCVGAVRFASRSRFMIELAGALLTVLCITGVWIFISASLPSSGSNSGQSIVFMDNVVDIVRLLYRLVANPVSAIYLVPLGIMLLGMAMLYSFAALSMLKVFIANSNAELEKSSKPLRGSLGLVGVSAVMALGLAILIVASFITDAFNVLSPRYNIWLLPFVFALLSPGLACMSTKQVAGKIARIAAVMAIAGSLVGAFNLIRFSKLYSHGPGDWIANMITLSDRPLAVIHNRTEEWGHSYFPLYYYFADDTSSGLIKHYLLDKTGEVSRIVPDGLQPILDVNWEHPPWAESSQIWVHTNSYGSAELAKIARGKNRAAFRRPQSLPDSWPAGEPVVYNSFFSARVWSDTPAIESVRP